MRRDLARLWHELPPNPCVSDTGACCHPDGTCTFVLQTECTDNYLGAGTVCSPNPCPQPEGACCAADGSCTFVTQSECTGNWLGYGSNCSPNLCPLPSGACCGTNGGCTLVPESACAGIWLGYGSVCVPNPCPQGGACCVPDGACQVLLADCQSGGGSWMGPNTFCLPYPCPPMQVSICQIRQDDSNGVPLLIGRKVEFEGVALVDTGTWSTTIQEFQLTDGNCCLDVFGGPMTPTVHVGDRVHVVGTVAQYNGKTEISTPGLSFEIVSTGNPLPPPTYITTLELSVKRS